MNQRQQRLLRAELAEMIDASECSTADAIEVLNQLLRVLMLRYKVQVARGAE